jgi:hypothetical protein
MLMTPEDEQFLDALLEALRADEGKELRRLLRSLSSKSKDPVARKLAEVLVQHPELRDLVPH